MKVRVSIEERPEVLDSGYPTGTAAPVVLYLGAAEWSGPSRQWEQAAALEGVLAGSVSLHTAADLSRATHVVVKPRGKADVEYLVGSVERDGDDWTMRLRGVAP